MAKLTNRAGCVVFSKYNKCTYIALIKYNGISKFDIPRGGFDKSQDLNLVACAKREVLEELGIDIFKNKLYKVREYEEWNINKNSGIKLHYDITIFTTIINGLPKLNPLDKKEIDYAKWIEFTSSIKLLYYNMKNIEAIKSIDLAYLTALRYKLI